MAHFLELQEVTAPTIDNAEKPGCAEELLMYFVPVEVSKINLNYKQVGLFCSN